MVGMWYVLGAIAVVAVVVAAVSVLRRPSAEDLSSVRHYHSALGTLEHLSERSVLTTDDPRSEAGTGPEPADHPTTGSEPRPRSYRRPDAVAPSPRLAGMGGAVDAPPATPRSSSPVPPPVARSERPEPGIPLVFDDAKLQDRFHTEVTAGAPRSRMDRAQRHALESMNHRPRRGLTVAAAVVVVALLFGVLAIVGSQRQHPKRTTGGATSSTAHAATPTAPASGSRHRTKATPTTAPPQLVALSSTAGTAVYPVSAAAYRLTISTSGPCWVNATSVSDGTTLWTGTMQAGGLQQIQATGATRVELGTLAVALQVDGVPVMIPAIIRSPFVLTFEPALAAPGGSGVSSTTTTSVG
jgi:hypothetical protein